MKATAIGGLACSWLHWVGPVEITGNLHTCTCKCNQVNIPYLQSPPYYIQYLSHCIKILYMCGDNGMVDSIYSECMCSCSIYVHQDKCAISLAHSRKWCYMYNYRVLCTLVQHTLLLLCNNNVACLALGEHCMCVCVHVGGGMECIWLIFV